MKKVLGNMKKKAAKLSKQLKRVGAESMPVLTAFLVVVVVGVAVAANPTAVLLIAGGVAAGLILANKVK
jgi:hypothetical protein